MSPISSTEPPRGRPRSPAVDAEILDAALDLLESGGYAALSIEAVASRAGVGKTSIYRRYGSKSELVAAAAARRGDIPALGGLPADLRLSLVVVVGWLLRSVSTQKVAFLGAMFEGMRTDPALAASMREILDRDQRSIVDGPLAQALSARPDLDPGSSLLIAQVATAMVVHRVLMGDDSDETAFVAFVVDDVLLRLLGTATCAK